MLIVLTGKTAAGKDTILKQILSKYPNFKKIITTTTRKIRPGEQDGVDYNFISREAFEAKLKNNEFIESVEYGGNLYGTYKSELEKHIHEDAIWRIDPSRAGQIRDFIKKTYPIEMSNQLLQKLVVIFITCSEDVILQRLKERSLSEEEIEKRLRDDQQIWEKFKGNYDFVVENVPGKLDKAVKEIIQILALQLSS